MTTCTYIINWTAFCGVKMLHNLTGNWQMMNSGLSETVQEGVSTVYLEFCVKLKSCSIFFLPVFFFFLCVHVKMISHFDKHTITTCVSQFNLTPSYTLYLPHHISSVCPSINCCKTTNITDTHTSWCKNVVQSTSL